MPAIMIEGLVATFDSQAQLQTLACTPSAAADTTTTAGKLLLTDGYNKVVTQASIYFPSWVAWMRAFVRGTKPPSTEYYCRFRVAATEEALAEAAWSEYIEHGLTDAGQISFGLRVYTLNHPEFNVGPYMDFETTLER